MKLIDKAKAAITNPTSMRVDSAFLRDALSALVATTEALETCIARMDAIGLFEPSADAALALAHKEVQ